MRISATFVILYYVRKFSLDVEMNVYQVKVQICTLPSDSSRQKCDQLWYSHRLRRHHVLSVSLECQLSDTAVNRDSETILFHVT